MTIIREKRLQHWNCDVFIGKIISSRASQKGFGGLSAASTGKCGKELAEFSVRRIIDNARIEGKRRHL
jgi:hypothetical protein